MANATVSSPTTAEGHASQTVKVHADFQSISTYVTNDVSPLVAVNRRHLDQLGGYKGKFVNDFEESSSFVGEWQGFPLLLPLTVGVEFEQTSRRGSPTDRHIYVSIDSLSILLGSEDMGVITLATKSMRRRPEVEKLSRTYVFDVAFESHRLGLGLRKDGNQIVVDHVGGSARETLVESGDVVHAINGSILHNSAAVTLSAVVDRLAVEPRPLIITFARLLSESDLNASDVCSTPASSKLGEVYEGSNTKVEVSLVSGLLTIIEKDVTLFRGRASNFDLGCSLSRTSRSLYRVDISSGIAIDYYNLRAWEWEPLVEPTILFISTEYHDPYLGPKEISVEVGDRSNGPLCVNLTDAAAESLSKYWKWGLGNDEPELFEQTYVHSFSEAESGSFILEKTAKAALIFAEKQTIGNAKPVVFKNRSGVSIAIAINASAGQKTRGKGNWLAVGVYAGVHDFDCKDVAVVGNGEEAKFLVEVVADQTESSGRKFPPVTVAFQAMSGTAVDPIRDLDISVPGAWAFPITVEGVRLDATRDWVSWMVDQTDERTMLTLGTTVCISSLVQGQFEVAVEVALVNGDFDAKGTNRMSVGFCRSSDALCLPLWLARPKSRWRCLIRPSSSYQFSSVFTIGSTGAVEDTFRPGQLVECRPVDDRSKSIFFTITAQESNSVLSFQVDCIVSVRNSLPSMLTVNLASTQDIMEDVDGYAPSTRESYELPVGTKLEVFDEWGAATMWIRLKLSSEQLWSKWVDLSHRFTSILDKDSNSEVQQVQSVDDFGYPIKLSVRVNRKCSGFDVTIFAELWCSNSTALPLVFGCVEQEAATSSSPREESIQNPTELSAAEAALKEISSLFELGYDGKGITNEPSSHRHSSATVDVFRIPGQSDVSITEEVFEYIEVEEKAVKRRWYASQNPRAIRENFTARVIESTSWRWIDSQWVRRSIGVI